MAVAAATVICFETNVPSALGSGAEGGVQVPPASRVSQRRRGGAWGCRLRGHPATAERVIVEWARKRAPVQQPQRQRRVAPAGCSLARSADSSFRWKEGGLPACCTVVMSGVNTRLVAVPHLRLPTPHTRLSFSSSARRQEHSDHHAAVRLHTLLQRQDETPSSALRGHASAGAATGAAAGASAGASAGVPSLQSSSAEQRMRARAEVLAAVAREQAKKGSQRSEKRRGRVPAAGAPLRKKPRSNDNQPRMAFHLSFMSAQGCPRQQQPWGGCFLPINRMQKSKAFMQARTDN